MRVLFTMYPSLAQVYPIVPLAWALQCAGHEVRIASHGSFAPAIAKTGLTPVSLGDPASLEARLKEGARQPGSPQEVMAYVDAMGLNELEREHWIAFYQWHLNPVSDYVRLDLPDAHDLMSFARTWKPDLVLWDLEYPSGAVAARVAGAASVRLTGANLDYWAYCLDRLGANRDRLRAAGLDENPLADIMRPLAEHYGTSVDEELLVGSYTIDSLMPGLALETSAKRLPLRLIPYNGGEVFQEWLYEKPSNKRLALSLGESTRRYIAGDWGRTPKVFKALADVDVEIIATLNALQLSEVDKIPDNVKTIEWVPLTQLLPTTVGLIHHGGLGTSSAAIASRIPQIVFDTDESVMLRPLSMDAKQDETGTYRAGREYGVAEEEEQAGAGWVLPAKDLGASPYATFITERGAGIRLNHQIQTVNDFREQIERVLHEPSFQEGADALHEKWLGLPSPIAMVKTLEEITAAK